MQEAIRNMILQLANDGLTKTEIGLYLQGAHDGIRTFSDYLKASRLKVEKDEADPLFIHTWNHVVEIMTEQIDTSVKVALEAELENFKGNKDEKPK